MNELALFAGAGGGILGGLLLGWRTVCAVEVDAYCRRVLLARQRDGVLEPFPIWDDVRTFDGRPWRGSVDVVSGGFPCQDISPSGKHAGLDGERSGLWSEMRRIVSEVRPRSVFVENSAALVARGLGRVLGDLSALGFHARWGVLGARDAGLPHERERLWIVAHSNEVVGETWARTQQQRREPPHVGRIDSAGVADSRDRWVEMAREFHRMDDGLADKVDSTCALGNGQVPAVARLAWEVLK